MRAALAIPLLAVSLAACRADPGARRDPLPPGEAEQLLAERIWLDRLPTNDREQFHVAVFDREGTAIAQRRSIWKGEFEIVLWDVDDDHLQLVLPHGNRKVTTHFRVERLSANPSGADVMLILEVNPIGPREYLGFAPEGGGAVTRDDVDAWLRGRGR